MDFLEGEGGEGGEEFQTIFKNFVAFFKGQSN